MKTARLITKKIRTQASKIWREMRRCAALSLLASALLLSITLGITSAWGNPQGMTVGRGNATATANGQQLTVNASQGAVLNWNSFNIGKGETTTFVQPSSRSVVWNRINDPNLSRIWGNLNANGWVVLMNQNGFYFGPNSVVNVNGLVVTTVPTGTPPSAGGPMWQYSGPMPLASIINHGEIRTKTGGAVFLISERIENHGTISAPEGTVSLQAGQEVLLCDRPDGRGLSTKIKLPAGVVDNQGRITADAGTILLQAQAVSQNGLLQANAIRNSKGVIEILASDTIDLGPNSVVAAKGGSTGVSQAGDVTIKADKTFTDQAGSQIDVSGGAQGGNGGAVEISAPYISGLNTELRGSAAPRFVGASLLLDPTDIVLATTGTGSAPGGQVHSGDTPATLRLNVNTAFIGFHTIKLQATRDITLDSQTSWNLNTSTGVNVPDENTGQITSFDPNCSLTLESGRNIIFKDGAKITAGAGWSVNLSAGMDFSRNTIQAGQGGIYLSGTPGSKVKGNGSILSTDGNINLRAGHEVLIGKGFISSVGGGNISITTLDGDVDAGTSVPSTSQPFGFSYSRIGYTVASTLGGITTVNNIEKDGQPVAGGNITINSGRDILSSDPGTVSGAYGTSPSDVTLNAAGRVTGKFLVRNGQGLIAAGVSLKNDNNILEPDEMTSSTSDIGSSIVPLTLGLMSGSWRLFASRDIFLNEVLNPNGVFNEPIKYKFDYALDASVSLAAGNSVQLGGLKPAFLGANSSRPPIYPPRLSVHARAGGITLANDLVLYPSPKGSLDFTTTDGGSLKSASGKIYQVIMSDSGSTDYTTFVSDHASTPLHYNTSDNVLRMSISGNLENVFVSSPERAEINIGGDVLNFAYEGQNLSANDVTSIHIGGNYSSRSDRTSVKINGGINTLLLDPLYSTSPGLSSRLSWDAASSTLTFQGQMTADNLNYLLHPSILAYNSIGQPILDANGTQVMNPTTFSADTAALQRLFQNSQDVPTSSLAYQGLQIGGPGRLEVTAHDMNLGISHGLRSVGTFLNSSLAHLSLRGADLALQLSGNLDMTSSQIASFNGGNIAVKSSGTLNIGSQQQFTSDDTPKGIYTGHGGNVSVEADGKIDINGSRIATYDGGDVSVISDKGDVNAGTGARGFFTVSSQQLNPQSGQLEIRNDRYFGSGIIAFTRPDSSARVGSIFVKAARDILANAGGVIQLAFNNSPIASAMVTLIAGRDIIADQSGVLGANVSLKAGHDIRGLVVAVQNIIIDASRNVTVNALGGGTVSVTAGGTAAGTFVGGGSAGVSAKDVTADVVSTTSTATSNGTTAAPVAAPPAAPVNPVAKNDIDKKITDSDDDFKKGLAKGNTSKVTKTVGRVTVILPGSNKI